MASSCPVPPHVSSRNAYLDHIRVLLTVLVVMHHTAITYGADGGWFFKEVEGGSLSPLVRLIYMFVTTVDQSYFMGFFFLLAGYFTPLSLARKGTGAFLKDRFVRLGIPLAAFALVLAPLTISFARLMVEGGTFFDGFYWIWIMHHYECGPMWFVQALLVFTLIYVVWAKTPFATAAARDDSPLPAHSVILASALATGLLAFGLRLAVPTGQNVFGMQIGYFATYVVLYYVGCRAARSGWLERVELRHALPWIVVSGLCFISLPFVAASCPDGSLFSGGWNRFALFYAMWEPFEAWGIILGLLWLSRRYLARTNAFWAGLAKTAFPAFFVHAPVLVAMTLAFHGWEAPALGKWLVVGSSATALSFAIGSVIVRLPGLRRVF